MASDTLPDGLDWSEPEARGECSFEAAGWSCRSTGFLWFSEARVGDERLYPCPRCNAGLFLEKSHARGTAAAVGLSCICCGSSVARLAYERALEELRAQDLARDG